MKLVGAHQRYTVDCQLVWFPINIKNSQSVIIIAIGYPNYDKQQQQRQSFTN